MLIKEYGVQVSGPLEQWAQEFASHLASLGYVWLVIRRALFVFAFVSNRLGARGLRPGDVTAKQVKHLREARRGIGYGRSLSKVLEFLREVGEVPPVRLIVRRTLMFLSGIVRSPRIAGSSG